jgi:hypothetical protein
MNDPRRFTHNLYIVRKLQFGVACLPMELLDRASSKKATAQWYRIMLEMLEVDDETWFQETASQRTQLRNQWTISLWAILPGNLISRFGNNAWPSTSPDLTAPDLFVRGYETSKVYVNKPHTITEVKEHIADEIKATEVELLPQDFKNVSLVVQNTYKYYF